MSTSIAIVGMSGRFPGAPDLDRYWRNLREGVESIRPLSDEELRAAGVAPSLLEDPRYVPRGAVLEGIDLWDAGFFGFNPKEAAIMDPQHRVFLELAWEALEHAGHPPERFPGSVGVFAGCGAGMYLWRNLMTHPGLLDSTGFFLLRHLGNDKDFLATRVSYSFDLRGPSITLQTACSTSLVAVHSACQSLLARECDMALAGAVTIELPHGTGYLPREGEILSPDGHCRPFDAAAEGTVFGSGAGVVVLRRLADAVADGDTVHAVILGTAINNDGAAKVGYFAPSVEGQSQAIAEALAMADVPPETVGFVEAHGTGTAVGDPIEVQALAEAYGGGGAPPGSCIVGSVKGNIGHLDTAAGIAGLVKAVLALKHGEIPPTLHFRRANPLIDFAATPFRVNAHLHPWPAGATPRRAGVSSLGVGGTNAHLVLEEPPLPPAATPSRPRQLLLLSGRTPGAVIRQAGLMAGHIDAHEDLSLPDLAWTLAVGRRHFRHRRAVQVTGTSDAVDSLLGGGPAGGIHDSGGRERRVVFLFGGGGVQHVGMAGELYRDERAFRQAVDRCLHLLDPHLDRDLRPFLLGDPEQGEGEEAQRPSLALPALFTVQYALAQLWRSWGVRPAAMLGHSMGEYTAACLSGVLSLADALGVVALRGRLFETLGPGAMLSVAMAPGELHPLLGAELALAAVNGPELSVASGPEAAIAALETRLATRGAEFRRVPIDVAAHSPMVEPILAPFRDHMETVRFGRIGTPFVSNVSGTWAREEEVRSPEYWVRHLRDTVRFSEGLDRVMEEPERILLEVGPGRAMGALARRHPARTASQDVIHSMRHPSDPSGDLQVLLDAVGRLWERGVSVDWDGFHAGEFRRRIPLPTYPFERQRHWVEAVSAPAPGVGEVQESASGRRPLTDWFQVPSWEPALRPRPGDRDGSGRWLVFGHREGPEGHLAREVARRLQARGAHVSVVEPGDAFRSRGAGAFELRPLDPDDHDALLQALKATGDPLEGIVHLWNVGEPGPDPETIPFHALLTLARSVARAGMDSRLRVGVVSSGMQSVAGEETTDPHRALLLGPVRVIPREMPGIRTVSIDLPRHLPSDAGQVGEVAARIVDEAMAGGEGVVALRGSERLVQRFRPLPLPPTPEDGSLLRPGGVYLITGGLGGLGRAVSEALASGFGARLVLVGRRRLPPREAWESHLSGGGDAGAMELIEAVRGLEEAGAEVVVETADVTDPEALRGVVRRTVDRFGTLHGVIHTAGILDDEPILLRTQEGSARVLAPKVRGTLALESALAGLPLDFLLLFSSRSSITGLAGQVDYTAANAFLDSYAHHRRARGGTPLISVGWDAWREVGMAARLATGGATPRPRPDGGRLEEGGEPAGLGPFQRVREDDRGRIHLDMELSPARTWLLADHRLNSGQPVLPGTGFLHLAHAAWSCIGGGDAVELRDVSFLTAFVVPDGTSRELRVVLEAEVGGRRRFGIEGRRGPGEEWTLHAGGTIGPPSGPAPAAAPRPASLPRTSTPGGGLPDHPHIRFGPRWASITRVDAGDGEALIHLELPGAFHGDLEEPGVHAALLDLATGGARELVAGPDTGDFHVPASYGLLTVRGPLPPRLTSHVRRTGGGDGMAAFDVTLTGEDGREVARVTEFVMVKVEGGLLVEPPSAPVEPSGPARVDLDEAIAPSEGVEALHRILRPGMVGHVLVTPHDLQELLARADAPPTPRAGAGPPRPAVADPREEELAALLRSHDAVADAAALIHDDPHESRVVAFVLHHPGHFTTVSEIRRFVRSHLDEGLVPNAVVEVDTLPRRADGTLDRGRLPDPFAMQGAPAPPETPTEITVAGIWQELLGVEAVGRHDNFLDLGGHSLLAIRALLRIEQALGIRPGPHALTLLTLEQVAAECDRQERGGEEGAGADAIGDGCALREPAPV